VGEIDRGVEGGGALRHFDDIRGIDSLNVL
jgi:hypothetical protein